MGERKRSDRDSKPDEDASSRAVARYLADMTAQLESMARDSKLELLAYLLAMARAEAESAALKPLIEPTSSAH